jgi:hypothetical protein
LKHFNVSSLLVLFSAALLLLAQTVPSILLIGPLTYAEGEGGADMPGSGPADPHYL